MSINQKKLQKVISQIDNKINQAREKRKFCQDHNFKLEAEKFKFLEDELLKIKFDIEGEFGI